MPVVRGSNIANPPFDTADMVYVSDEKAASLERCLARPGDIVVTQRGTLGQVGRIPYNRYKRWLISQSQMALRVDPSRGDPDFVYWSLRAPQVQQQIHDRAIVTGVPHINLGVFAELAIAFPPRDEQERIAAVLGTLDDKVASNRRLASRASDITRTEFRRIFGGRIEGPTPLGDHVSVVRGRSYKSSELEPSERALVTLKSVRPGGGYNAEGLKPYTGDFQHAQVVHPGELVVAHTDLTQNAAVIGKPALLPDKADFAEVIASLDLAIVRPDSDRVSVPFLFHLLLEAAFQQHAYGYANGSTVLHLAKEAIPSFSVELPDRRLLSEFDALATPMLSWSNRLSTEARTLAGVRDALVPELVSGAIRVPYTADPHEVIEPVAAEFSVASP